MQPLQPSGCCRTRSGAGRRRAARLAVAAAALLTGALGWADASNGLPTQLRPSLPLFGPGAVFNFTNGDNQALTNASAHAAWSLAIPLAGRALGGRKGMWIAGLSWIGLSVVQESLFHAPAHPGPGYPAEVRSDLATRLLPAALLLAWDALHGDPGPAVRDAGPGHLPGEPRVQRPAGAPAPHLCLDAVASREVEQAGGSP